MSNVIKIEANVRWRAEHGASQRRWVGFCDELGLSTEAASLDELHSLIPEAMHLLMVDLLEDNELDDFLRQKGWESSQTSDGDHVEFDLPWEMIAEGGNGPQRERH